MPPQEGTENNIHSDTSTSMVEESETTTEPVEPAEKAEPPAVSNKEASTGGLGARVLNSVMPTASFEDEMVEVDITTKHKKNGKEVAVVQAPPKLNYKNLRAARISVTLLKPTADTRLGIGFKTNKDGKIEVAAITTDSIFKQSPLQVGDVIWTVNNRKATSEQEMIQHLKEIEGYVTVVANTGGNPTLVQAMVTKPTPESMVGIGFLKETALQINHISPRGLMSHSCLSQGDVVLSVNTTLCSGLTAEEAAEIVKQSPKHVTIVAMRPQEAAKNELTRTQKFMQGMRKAGVAVGGGAMVGVGLVFIPTLPPPFGEILIVGGVSLLGTEFEGPKRVVKGARDKLAEAVGPAEEGGDQEATVQRSDSKDSGDGSAASIGEDGQPRPKTVKTRLKNFGRNVVLPFMDQMVGDKSQEGEIKDEKKDQNVDNDAAAGNDENETENNGVSPETSNQDNTPTLGSAGEVDTNNNTKDGTLEQSKAAGSAVIVLEEDVSVDSVDISSET